MGFRIVDPRTGKEHDPVTFNQFTCVCGGKVISRMDDAKCFYCEREYYRERDNKWAIKEQKG